MKKAIIYIALLSVVLYLITRTVYNRQNEITSDNALSDYAIYISENDIAFDPTSKERIDSTAKHINKANAPMFFNASTDKYINVSSPYNNDVFLITSNYYDHGSFSSNYGLIFNANTGRVLYETGDLLLDPNKKFGHIEIMEPNKVGVCHYPVDMQTRTCDSYTF